MICLIALIIFSILGIFSLTYRNLAKEALDCVFRRIQLKPCDTGFDQKIRAKVTGKILKFNPGAARFIRKYFEVFSWIFLILLLVSFFFSARGIYYLVTVGSCDPHSTTCIFKQGEVTCGGPRCQDECLCEKETCESPEYKACEGNCECQKEVCGKRLE